MTTSNINIVESLLGSKKIIHIKDLEETIRENFDIGTKTGLVRYEYFDLLKQNFKIYFDIEKYIEPTEEKAFNLEEYQGRITEKLNKIFNTDDKEWAISQDHRPVRIKDKVTKQKVSKFKISFHFIATNLYTNGKEFIPLIRDSIKPYLSKSGIDIDSSVYSEGLQKFRIVFCKKDKDVLSLLKPITYPDNFSKHIIQYLDGCEELDVKNLNMDCINVNLMNTDIDSDKNDKIKKEYQKIGKVKKTRNGCVYDVKCICPFVEREHTNNHCYIIIQNGNKFLKCFAEGCKGKVKVLFKKLDTQSANFSKKTFKAIDIDEEKKTDYYRKRDYFEKYYLFFCDDGVLFRIDSEEKEYGSKKEKYTLSSLKNVKATGLADLSYYYYKKEGDKVVKKKGKFIKKYIGDDEDKTEYYNVIFKAYGKNEGKYNLFNGFDYTRILNENETITDEDIALFNFFKHYLLKYVFRDNKEEYDYFMKHMASIINTPNIKNHLIYYFYSKETGTGKSSLTKFLSKVIGEKYSYFGSIGNVFGEHSNSAVGKFLNILDEADYKDTRQFCEKLKDYSQSETRRYNPKGLTETQLDNLVRIIMTGNGNIYVPTNDRRIVVAWFLKIKDKAIKEKIKEFYENKKMVYLFGQHLEEITNNYNDVFDWAENRPINEAYKKMKYSDSVSGFLRHLYYGTISVGSKYKTYKALRYITKKLKQNTTNHLKNTLHLKFPKEGDLYDLYKSYVEANLGGKYSHSNFKEKLSEYEECKIVVSYRNGQSIILNLEKICEIFKLGEFKNNYKDLVLGTYEEYEESLLDEDEEKVDSDDDDVWED